MRIDEASMAGLVASVADGWPLDWGALGSSSGEVRARDTFRKLRVVAGIAAFHRSLSATDRRCDRDHTSGPEPPTPDASAQIGRWGRFLLLRKLGSGAYGDVYCAHDTQLDRAVALKLLKRSPCASELYPRLLEEARMLAQVRHPNVVAVYGAGEHQGQAGLWMEFIRGVTLEEILATHGPLSAGEAALVGQDLCRALAAVHGAGLVHRDVKVANVMREVGGRIVLMDFGAGGYRGQEPTRKFAGTPLYVAPEVCAGAEATDLSDIYSLGVVLFRLVTRTYPRRARPPKPPGEAHECEPVRPLRDLRPDLPDVFVAVVEKALARDPADRPRSAGAVRAALGIVLGGLPAA